MGSGPRSIVIKSPNWLGDAVMALPAIWRLRRAFPDALLAVLARRNVAELFQNEACVNLVLIEESPSRPVAWAKSALAMRRHKFELAVIFPRSFRAALGACFGKIPVRTGYAGEMRGALLTQSVPRSPELLKVHRVKYYMALADSTLELCGVSGTPENADVTPRLELSEEEKIWAGNFVESLKLVPGTRLVGVNPGATYGSAKMWPTAKFVQLLNELRGRGEFRFLIFGGRAEAAVSDEVARGAGEPWAMNLAGKTTVRELAALASWCDVFVTNDTGPMHVAAAVGTPVVAIFGPTDWVATPPYCEKWTLVRKTVECSPCLKRNCPLGHHDCMKGIGVEDVLDAVGKWISV